MVHIYGGNEIKIVKHFEKINKVRGIYGAEERSLVKTIVKNRDLFIDDRVA